MSFQPARYLGQPLPDLMADLAGIDPAALDNIQEVELHSALASADAVECRPTTLMLSTIPSADLPANHPDVELPGVVLEKLLGGGGQGWVYLARVLATDRTVAIKVLRADPFNQQAAAREAELCCRVRHRNILRVFRAERAGPFRVVIMELVQGEPLHYQRTTGEAFRRCFGPLADALCVLHAQRIVHCDIKPANILVRQSDGSPVLVDFGIAVDLDNPAVPQGISGTPYFMAPEVFRENQPHPNWDAYSLGVTAATLRAGRVDGFETVRELHDGKLSGKFDKALEQTVARITEPEVRDWITALIGRKPETRLAALEEARRWEAA